jgi:hypothetical protein
MRRSALLLAAIAALVATGFACAEPLGKLFFTPERRAALERQRQLNIQETRTLEGSSVSLDGIVTRSSGRTTVWVNQRPQNEDASGTGVTAAVSPRNPAQAVVTPGEEPPASLKVGESINRATREKANALGGGRVTVRKTNGQ